MQYPASAPLYPAADRYAEAFGEVQLRDWLARRNVGGITFPLSVARQLPRGKYTPKRPVEEISAVRKTLTANTYLTKEIRLVAEVLSATDRHLLEAALLEKVVKWPGDVIGIGPGAFGRVGPACYQNHERLEKYCAALDAGRLPVWRGIELTQDDLARRAIIESLSYQFRVSIESIEIAHVIDFHRTFTAELADLQRLERQGLVELAGDWIEVTPQGLGRLADVCAVFDRYLRTQRERASYTRVM